MKVTIKSAIALAIVTLMMSCGGPAEQKSATGNASPAAQSSFDPNDPKSDKGIGPVTQLELGPLDQAMAAEGQEIFNKMCTACHKPKEKFVGPAPKGILGRRSPEWIMNMILNPEEMIQKDPIAKKLLVESNLAPMANQHLTEAQARKILEYFRTLK